MIALLQRVACARVEIEGRCVGAIGPGLLLFVCAEPDDTETQAERLIDRVLGLRVFADDAGRMNLSVQQIGGGLLVVSQFTLLADTRKGRRPSFTNAAAPDRAVPLYEHFIDRARAGGLRVETGEFGAHMQVELANDGPVTILLDSDVRRGAPAA